MRESLYEQNRLDGDGKFPKNITDRVRDFSRSLLKEVGVYGGVALLGAAVLYSEPSRAAVSLPCGSRATMAATLERNYKEVPVSVGLANDGNMVEVYSSSSGSWTIVITSPSGRSCLVAAGEAWQPLLEKLTINDPES